MISRYYRPAFAGLSVAAATLSVVTLWVLGASTPTNAGSADPAQIVIKNFTFEPSTVTIKAGSSVNWTNQDNEPHTVVSDTGLFRSAAVDTDETYKFKFEQPGTYHFTCSIHPRMVGTIIVE